MARKMSPTKAQAETEKMVTLYNMGLLSRKFMMKHYGLGQDAEPKLFWQRHQRTVDEAKATFWVRLIGG